MFQLHAATLEDVARGGSKLARGTKALSSTSLVGTELPAETLQAVADGFTNLPHNGWEYHRRVAMLLVLAIWSSKYQPGL